MANKYMGKWRIVEMELWDKDFIDLVVPGHITLEKDGVGNFQFGAVEGEIDYRIERIADLERLEFTWAGQDETDPECGRGWAVLEGNELHGRLYFHFGDDSWFKAKKSN
jgi:hypothetical protein